MKNEFRPGEKTPQYFNSESELQQYRAESAAYRSKNPFQPTEHIVGPGPHRESENWTLLGPDFESVLAQIIEDEMQLHHDACTEKKEHILAFLETEEETRASYWRGLASAERKLKQYRRTQDMRPFSWALEYRETVVAILGLKNGNPRTANTIESRQKVWIRKILAKEKKGDSFEDSIEERDLIALHRTNKIKPEYQGANHPLEINQIKRR